MGIFLEDFHYSSIPKKMSSKQHMYKELNKPLSAMQKYIVCNRLYSLMGSILG